MTKGQGCIVTDLIKWCIQSDWPVHPLILARQFAVCMVICCPVSTQPRLCSSDWLDAHPFDSSLGAVHRQPHSLYFHRPMSPMKATGSEYCTRKPYFRHLKATVGPWKLGQGHQNIINSSPCLCKIDGFRR